MFKTNILILLCLALGNPAPSYITLSHLYILMVSTTITAMAISTMGRMSISTVRMPVSTVGALPISTVRMSVSTVSMAAVSVSVMLLFLSFDWMTAAVGGVTCEPTEYYVPVYRERE